MHRMSNEQKTNSKETTNGTHPSEAEKSSGDVSEKPFTEGMAQGLDEHRERLKKAIRTHAKNNRKKVKARKSR
jgi:hypothetical protein